MELEKADALVNSAYRRVQELDRFSRSSSPIGKAELAIIALQALAELGALADWTVGPGITHSIVQLLDENERKKFESFREFVKHAGGEDRPVAGQASSMSDVSDRAEMAIDPAPSGLSRMATEEQVLADEVDELTNLIDVTAVRRFPVAPLLAVDRAEIALFVGPFVPDADLVLLQPADIGVAAQKP